jgi:hypothetical protein
MYGLIQHKFDGNPTDLFNIFGHKTPDDKKVLTIGSLDIGGGTSDLMICEYELTFNNSTELKPKPLYFEGFHLAGDDLIKNIIQSIIIEGPQINPDDEGCSGVIENFGYAVIGNEIREKINGFFGRDAATMSYLTRMMRVNFLNQIGIPIAHKYLEIANNSHSETIGFQELFQENKPSEDLLNYFHEHFGFRFEELRWNLNPKKVKEIVRFTFSKLIKQVAKLMHLYRCDFIIISGRPCNLKAIEDLFLEIHPVQPNRFINMNNYWIGKWYPFADNNGYIKDPKTIVATGALIGLMGTKFFKLNKFKINADELKMRLQSTANYLGQIQDNVIPNVIMNPQQKQISFKAYYIPLKIGMKKVDSNNYPARYIYQIEYNELFISNQARSRTMSNPGNFANVYQNIINENNAKLPFTFKVSREFDVDREKLELEEVIDMNGDSISNSMFTIKLITLASENGYWFDTAEFTLAINSRN